MGYACPVCETPQADARHLANHLAFTAMLGREDHRAWLDEHAPEWEDRGEHELAEQVEREAKEVEFPQVFEDTAGGLDGEHDHDHEPDDERSGALFDDERDLPERGPGGGGHGAGGTPPRDEETREILEEAREMTRQMLDEDDDTGETEPNTDDEGRADDGRGPDDEAEDSA